MTAAMIDVPRPLPMPVNEPVLGYHPGSRERAELRSAASALPRLNERLALAQLDRRAVRELLEP